MNRRQFLGVVSLSASAGCMARFSGTATTSSCPPFPSERDGQTICDGKERDVPIYLHAKSDTVSVAEGTISFAFVNTADEDVSYGPCFWSLYKKSPDGWQTIGPTKANAIAQILHAGSTRELALRVGQQDTTPMECNPYYVAELDAGRYLFGIQGEMPDGTTTLFLASFGAE